MTKAAGLVVLTVFLAGFGPWTSELGQKNQLVGKVFDGREFVSKDRLIDRIASTPYVLLGEVHDNPDHHRLQARMIRAMVDAGRRPAVVLEMLPRSVQSEIDGYLANEGANAAGFGAALDWEKRGWPDWTMYQPILEVVLSAGLKVFAGNLPKQKTREIAKQGYEALDGQFAWKAWGLDKPLPTSLQKRLNTTLQEGHCNMLPQTALPAMRKVQRVRDASMADALLAAGAQSGDGAVLIAGGGHVRSDFAVPFYLKQRGAGSQWVSVQFTPVHGDSFDPLNFIRKNAEADGHVIYVFTPSADDIDHCVELRKRFGKTKPKGG